MFNYLGELLRKNRKKCDKTQKEVAELLGINRSTYSYYESGKIIPDLKTIVRISKVFEVPFTDLLKPENNMVLADSKKKSSLLVLNKDEQKKYVLEKVAPDEMEILEIFRKTNEKNRKKFLKMIRMIFGE